LNDFSILGGINGLKRQDFVPVDPKFPCYRLTAGPTHQLHDSIHCAQPSPDGKLAIFHPFQKLSQKATNARDQNLQVFAISSFFLGYRAGQFELTGKEGNGIEDTNFPASPFSLNRQ